MLHHKQYELYIYCVFLTYLCYIAIYNWFLWNIYICDICDFCINMKNIMLCLHLIHMILSYCIITMIYHMYIGLFDFSTWFILYLISLKIHTQDGTDTLCLKLGTWYGKRMNAALPASCEIWTRSGFFLNVVRYLVRCKEMQGAWSLWGRHGLNLAPPKKTKL